MIDEERTLEVLGVDVSKLSNGSRKGVWAVCKKCGRGRELSFGYAKKDKLCPSCARKGKYTGKNSPSWKGGVSLWRAALHQSNAYKNWRSAVFKRDEYTCRMCDCKQRWLLEAHHIEPVRDHKNDLLIFDIDNGITLCKECHGMMRWREHEYAAMLKQLLD